MHAMYRFTEVKRFLMQDVGSKGGYEVEQKNPMLRPWQYSVVVLDGCRPLGRWVILLLRAIFGNTCGEVMDAHRLVLARF
jgi:hypothetical protein